MVTRMFESQLGRNMEVYIDYMVIKSKVSSGKFLGYMITYRGIEVNPDQIKVINSLPPPQYPKEVPKLIGMATALRAVHDAMRPIFWGIFAPHPFPIPRIGQLVDATVENPRMNFLDAFQGYHQIPLTLSDQEKTAFHAPTRNYHYRVMPFGLKNAGSIYQRMVTWMFESQIGRNVEAYIDDMVIMSKYMPRTAIQGQVLANFVAEFTESMAEDGNGKVDVMMVSTGVATWEVYTDGAANRKGLGVGIMLITPEMLVMEKSLFSHTLHLGFLATNNEAKYEALLVGMSMLNKLGGEVIKVHSDSRLVVGQVNGKFETRDEHMQGYLAKVRQAQTRFKSFAQKQISKGHNSHADSLAMLATSLEANLPRVVLVEDMANHSLDEKLVVGVHNVQVGPNWMDPLITFLTQGQLPDDKVEAEKIRRKAPHY
ncbi:uncharacterized protein LOC142625094 [Castanea sativa]|uniref:uncharacterized protein LOC142625094 n=1 Tax=Castanea sativa TaxID=21020 RepID=UPI003F6548ED